MRFQDNMCFLYFKLFFFVFCVCFAGGVVVVLSAKYILCNKS